jgi:rubrerythrin
MESGSKDLPRSFQCIDALELSLNIEKQGFLYYDNAVKSAVDPRVRDIFKRLADDEKEHMQSLQSKARFLQPALKNKASRRENKVENFIKNEILGKVFPAPVEYKSKACMAETDLEALDIGIDSEKKSIELLSQLVAGEKKMDVRVIFNHLLVEEKKHLMALEQLKQTLIQE